MREGFKRSRSETRRNKRIFQFASAQAKYQRWYQDPWISPLAVGPAEARLAELQHYMQREADALVLAKDVVKQLEGISSLDQKALAEAQARVQESSQKLDLLRLSHERCLKEKNQEPPPPPPQQEQAAAAAAGGAAAGVCRGAPPVTGNRVLSPQLQTWMSSVLLPVRLLHQTGLFNCRNTPGKLEVRLLGCEDLLKPQEEVEEVEDGSPAAHRTDGPTAGVGAVLRLDGRLVGRTRWAAVSRLTWDQKFCIQLERLLHRLCPKTKTKQKPLLSTKLSTDNGKAPSFLHNQQLCELSSQSVQRQRELRCGVPEAQPSGCGTTNAYVESFAGQRGDEADR
ncbi:hypothetical protein INR49_019259 [Caranx melampygus]|nr:hypothetical protein INR49_019259 [Caranx melampygus]